MGGHVKMLDSVRLPSWKRLWLCEMQHVMDVPLVETWKLRNLAARLRGLDAAGNGPRSGALLMGYSRRAAACACNCDDGWGKLRAGWMTLLELGSWIARVIGVLSGDLVPF